MYDEAIRQAAKQAAEHAVSETLKKNPHGQEHLTAVQAAAYPGYLSTEQAAAYLNMSRQWLEIGRHKGYGPPYIKLGRAVRYKRSALDEWMLARQQSHTAEDGASRG